MTREEYDKKRAEARERHTGDQYGYYGEMLDICLDYIASIEARNAELEKLAVVWHRYPEERPTVNTHENCSRVLKDFLVVCCGGVVTIGNYVTYPTTFWNKQNVTHWAERPAPPEE